MKTDLFGEELIFPKNHEESEEEHDETVTSIAKHHRKQEGKGDDAEWSCGGGRGVESKKNGGG